MVRCDHEIVERSVVQQEKSLVVGDNDD